MIRDTVPVTVLTGFLGAGKTTLVNRILAGAHGRRFAVVENEFGEINIDADLLLKERTETIVTLSNGCVCCTVRGDLANALARLAQQRAAGEIAFDHVLLETTGLADPGPIARTFMAETELLAHFHLDGIVTLFDALHGERSLTQSPAAQAQLAYADRILISKTDQLPGATADALHARLAAMNAAAQVDAMDVRNAPWGEVFEKLLEARGYQFDRVRFLPLEPAAGVLDPAAHGSGIVSVSFSRAGLLDGVRLNQAFAAIKARYGERLWRIKGVLALSGMTQRVVMQGVQGLIQVNPAALWRPFEPRASRMVLIGRELERDWILAQLGGCAEAPAAKVPARPQKPAGALS